MPHRSGFAWIVVVYGLALAATAFAAPRDAFVGVDDKWRRYESPNFELFSHARDRESRALLRRLELLRAVFADLVRLREQRPNLVTVYYFDSEKSFFAYTPLSMRGRDQLAGFYLNRPDRSVIVVSPLADDDEAQRVIFHEYIHHLTRVNGDDPALWYTEGIAEYFSTIQEDGKFLDLGKPIPAHVLYLRENRMMPLEALFSIGHSSASYNESERAGLFYAQSWALLHMWYNGENGATPERRGARDRFLRFVRSEAETGDPTQREQLFREAFGKTYAQTLSDLSEYMRTGRYSWSKVQTPEIPPEATYRMAPVARGEIRRRLAELDLRVNRSPVAKLAMLDAATAQPADIRAFEVLGTEALVDNDLATAKDRWNQAVELGTTNPGVLHELAGLIGSDWFSRIDVYFELPPDTAERLRKLIFQSIQYAPNQTQAYELLAWVEATVKKPSAKNISLVQEHLSTLRPRVRTLLALALVRIRFGDLPTARLLLDQADKEATKPVAHEWSEYLRKEIQRREEKHAAENP